MEVTKKVSNKLKQQRGSVMIHAAIITLIIMMLLAVSLETARVLITINMLIGKTDSAVLAVAASNVENVYTGVRESDGNARTGSDVYWYELVSTSEVINVLKNNLDLSEDGTKLQRSTSSGTAYAISDMYTSYENSSGGVLNFTTTLTVEIPLSFMGGLTITQDLEVSTSYEARY